MASVNRVVLLGNVGHTPKISYTQSGSVVCTFSMATSMKFKSDSGEVQENTEWHNCVSYGRLAEVINEYVQRGNRIYIEGRLRTRKYTARDGHDKWTTEIIVESAQIFRNKEAENDA